jgi:hypothetical protein
MAMDGEANSRRYKCHPGSAGYGSEGENCWNQHKRQKEHFGREGRQHG